jgi:hypothetical protein
MDDDRAAFREAWIGRALGIPQMDDDRAAFREAWKYRAAVRRFPSAFEAAEQLAEAEAILLDLLSTMRPCISGVGLQLTYRDQLDAAIGIQGTVIAARIPRAVERVCSVFD